MRRHWLLATSLILFCRASSEPGQSGPKTIVNGPVGTRLDQHLAGLAASGFSGAVLVARQGEILLHKGYGLADKGRGVPFSPSTVFDIGSITKQFTAAGILKLEMAGKVSVSDPIAKYFAEVPPDKTAIRLHHLLTHTAGFDHAYGDDTEVATRDATVSLILGKPLLSAPGDNYHYSNPGFSLLAAIVEKVSGEPYEKYLSEQFFAQAGMTRTGYRLPKWDSTEISRNYNGAKDNGPPLDRSWAPEGPYWHLFGNGGILSTTADMYLWEQALQGDKLLSAEAKRKLFAPHAPIDPERKWFYAYGWRVGKTERGTAVIGHTGGSDFGVWAAHFRFVDDGVVVIIGSNQLPVPGNEKGALPGRLLELALSR